MNHKSPVTALTNLEFIAEGRLNLLTLVNYVMIFCCFLQCLNPLPNQDQK